MSAFFKLWFKNLCDGIPMTVFILFAWIVYLGPVALLVWLTGFRWDCWIYAVISIFWIITAGTLGETIYSKWK